MNETKSQFTKNPGLIDNVYVQVQYEGKIYNSVNSTSNNVSHPVWNHNLVLFITDPKEPL